MKHISMALILLAGCSSARPTTSLATRETLVPAVDYHVHLGSPDDSAYIGAGASVQSAKDLIATLDAAGVRKALVLSTAYFFGAPDAIPDPARDEYTRVRAENEWTAAQVAEFPGRLVGYCSVNPLREYALREIARCRSLGLRGLKLHFANARLHLSDTADLRKVRAVFAAANAERLPLVVHLRSGLAPFGVREARIFIEQLMPEVPDVPVQLAHLAGWGSYDRATDEVLATFIDAMRSGEIDRHRLYFDISAVYLDFWRGIKILPAVTSWTPTIARRLREIGLDHVLFGTDGTEIGCCQPPGTFASFVIEQSGLTREEVRQVFGNVTPWMQ